MRPVLPRSMIRARGFTLTELMIALVVGALVVLAATAMVVASRGTYRTQDETTRIAESARFALDLGNRLVRTAGYTNFGSPNYVSLINGQSQASPPPSYVPDPAWTATADAYSVDGPNVVGANNSKWGGGAGYNGSDSLVIRFFGTSRSTPTGQEADGNILDCAGTAIPEPPPVPAGTDAAPFYRRARAYNVLFVALDPDNEPALKCVRQTFDASGTPSGIAGLVPQTLIRGVEDFQVLYGEAIPRGSPYDDLDLYPPATIVYRTGIGGANPVSNWGNVRSVRIAMVLRSAVGTRVDPEPATKTYHLFGDTYGTNDPGTDFALSSMGVADRTRLRRVVETTVFVRNRTRDWNDSVPAP